MSAAGCRLQCDTRGSFHADMRSTEELALLANTSTVKSPPNQGRALPKPLWSLSADCESADVVRARLARLALVKMQKFTPGALELVWTTTTRLRLASARPSE